VKNKHLLGAFILETALCASQAILVFVVCVAVVGGVFLSFSFLITFGFTAYFVASKMRCEDNSSTGWSSS